MKPTISEEYALLTSDQLATVEQHLSIHLPEAYRDVLRLLHRPEFMKLLLANGAQVCRALEVAERRNSFDHSKQNAVDLLKQHLERAGTGQADKDNDI